MKIREIINSLEADKKQLKEEIEILKEENGNLKAENKKLYTEIKFLKEQHIEKVDAPNEEPIVEMVGDEGLFEKPKKSRKKKVEPVEEVENA